MPPGGLVKGWAMRSAAAGAGRASMTTGPTSRNVFTRTITLSTLTL
jgi:hypothetical protein